MNRRTIFAGVSAIAAVAPIYILASFYGAAVQDSLISAGGKRFLAAHSACSVACDAAAATIWSSVALLVAYGMFLVMSSRFEKARLRRGFLAALPLLGVGSLLGRLLLDPVAPLPGLLTVLLALYAATGAAMYAGCRAERLA